MASTATKLKEAEFSKRLSNQLRLAGALLFNVSGSPYQKRGWPDLQVYSLFWSGHLELKSWTGGASTMQRIILRRLRRLGHSAYLLRADKDGNLRLQSYDATVISIFEGWQTMEESAGKIGRKILKWLKEHAIDERELDPGQSPDSESYH